MPPKKLRHKKRVQIHPEITEFEIPARVSNSRLDLRGSQDLRETENGTVRQDSNKDSDVILNFNIPKPPGSPPDFLLSNPSETLQSTFRYITQTSTKTIIFPSQLDLDANITTNPIYFIKYKSMPLDLLPYLLSLGITIIINPGLLSLVIPDSVLIKESKQSGIPVNTIRPSSPKSKCEHGLSYYTKSVLVKSLLVGYKGSLAKPPLVWTRIDAVDTYGPTGGFSYESFLYLLKFYVVLVVWGIGCTLYWYFGGAGEVYRFGCAIG